jgi:hypothetical protein
MSVRFVGIVDLETDGKAAPLNFTPRQSPQEANDPILVVVSSGVLASSQHHVEETSHQGIVVVADDPLPCSEYLI